jgi:flagellar hook-length control protein FliK
LDGAPTSAGGRTLSEAQAKTPPSDPGAAERRESFAEHLKIEPQAEKAHFDPATSTDFSEAKKDQSLSSLASGLTGPSAKHDAPGTQTQTAAPPNPVVHQIPLGSVPIEIGLKSLAGVNRFEIRLDPAELGRIDVRIDIGDDGEVKAQLVVDRVETLSLLRRDAKTLERAFEQAGLKPSEGGVDLSLRDPSGDGRFQHQQGRDERNPSGSSPGQERHAGDRPEAATSSPKPRIWRGASGVDLRI